MDNLVKILKDNKCKITPQRIAIYHAVRDSNDHPNAEAIYKKLAPTYPTISLATVYKSLELFAELKLIQVINIGENSFRYDSNTSCHPHVVCNQCQKVEDLDNEFFQHLSGRVESLSNYKITNQQLCFYGTCSDCPS
ncbi:transcriptional regulator PerR [Natronincola ferrireducens]|uniref:Fur family transcriptional regulator, peroxide stress response regulator n=1 Tax=Natronincola ferrireducens TaxID=393762 RepID=A0A1G9E1K6_9FIRM|nr:Fur family transcriptional regulator [Natronincola ferrireducens]SDK69992.1 Fur family transcriptional regulator, peroxide stress response regulator [Natronincola ferrireducens]